MLKPSRRAIHNFVQKSRVFVLFDTGNYLVRSDLNKGT